MSSRSLSTILAFLLGVPLGIGILWLFLGGPLADLEVARYFTHPVEQVTVILFACALGALLTKLANYVRESAALKRTWLPPWQGQSAPVEAAGPLLDEVERLGRGARGTLISARIINVLEFVAGRRSANDLDDHLRGLADNDDMALDGSYSLIRFISWAIPILGFLGTVLGITEAVAGVTPEVLEKSLSQVTEGLAIAFDTTALALALTMVVMFFSFVTERLEQTLLERVNTYAEEQLAHRFERTAAESTEFVEVVRRNSQVVLEATEKLVQRQSALWGQSLEEARRHWQDTGRAQQQHITQGLEQALERTLASHAQRLAETERRSQQVAALVVDKLNQLGAAMAASAQQQHQALTQTLQQVSAQTDVLARLTDNGANLIRLQEVLEQNLAALAGAGSFEQAVSSLTAAIHLLTARAGGPARAVVPLTQRPGEAA